MADEKKVINNDELEKVDGGSSKGRSWEMRVHVDSGYLALRPQPRWDQYNELAQMPNGATVVTYGEITNGTGLNGTPCQYRYVYYYGQGGWANAAFLR